MSVLKASERLRLESVLAGGEMPPGAERHGGMMFPARPICRTDRGDRIWRMRQIVEALDHAASLCTESDRAAYQSILGPLGRCALQLKVLQDAVLPTQQMLMPDVCASSPTGS